MSVRLLISASLLVVSASSLAAPAKNRLTVDRYLDWEDVARPTLAPDGEHIVYERRWVDALQDRWETALWIMNADGLEKPLPRSRIGTTLVARRHSHRIRGSR